MRQNEFVCYLLAVIMGLLLILIVVVAFAPSGRDSKQAVQPQQVTEPAPEAPEPYVSDHDIKVSSTPVRVPSQLLEMSVRSVKNVPHGQHFYIRQSSLTVDDSGHLWLCDYGYVSLVEGKPIEQYCIMGWKSGDGIVLDFRNKPLTGKMQMSGRSTEDYAKLSGHTYFPVVSVENLPFEVTSESEE